LTEDAIKVAENQDTLEEYPEWQHENIKIAIHFLDHEEDFIGLPTKYYVHEYQIMERFCLSLKNREISEALYRAIKGKGAFLRFKNEGLCRIRIGPQKASRLPHLKKSYVENDCNSYTDFTNNVKVISFI